MWGRESEKKREENAGPYLSLQQSWPSACLLRVGYLQEVGHSPFSCRDEVPETLQDTSTLSLRSQGNLEKTVRY